MGIVVQLHTVTELSLRRHMILTSGWSRVLHQPVAFGPAQMRNRQKSWACTSELCPHSAIVVSLGGQGI